MDKQAESKTAFQEKKSPVETEVDGGRKRPGNEFMIRTKCSKRRHDQRLTFRTINVGGHGEPMKKVHPALR